MTHITTDTKIINDVIEASTYGLLPKIWGPQLWHSLHCITFTYSLSPTEEEKRQFRNFFESLQFVIPCCICKTHFQQHISEGEFKLTDEVFRDRLSLTRWLYNLHCKVNKELGYDYDISFNDICNKYNAYRATCDMTPKDKIIAYKSATTFEMPIICKSQALKVAEYAKKLGVNDFVEVIEYTSKINHKSEKWQKHNKTVLEHVQDMRLNGIIGVDDDGKLTIQELNLIKQLSTTLAKKELDDAIAKSV